MIEQQLFGNRLAIRLMIASLLAIFLAACEPKQQLVSIDLTAVTDKQKAVGRATLLIDEQWIGETDSNGKPTGKNNKPI